MEEHKISVIMSAYNAESTVERAVVSIMNNRYSNLELIIVDDCSTDNTLSIVKRLADIYNNIIIVHHTTNKGAGLARRSGIDVSTGNLISFVDSDDEVHDSFFSVLISYMDKYNADIVVSIPQVIRKDTDKIAPIILSEEFHKGKDIIEKGSKYKKWLNSSLSRRECWNNIQYSGLRYIEDTPTMFKLLHYCDSLVLLDYKGYFYYQNPGSICHTLTPLKDTIYKLLGLIEILQFNEEHNKGVCKEAFMIRFKELMNTLKTSSYREIEKYKKELFKISQYFIIKII